MKKDREDLEEVYITINKNEESSEKKNKKGKKKNKSKKEKKNKSKVGKIIGIFFLILLIALIGFGGYFVWKIQINGGGLKGLTQAILETATGQDIEKKENLEPINILLLGESGIPGDDWKLTDSIMICSYNPKTQSASILSIPRDTYVGRKDKNEASTSYLQSYKMNTMYRNGTNVPQTVELVSELTGIKLDYYILVDTDIVKKMVDEIGGVWFDVPIDMNYEDGNQELYIHLEKGYQLIDGDKAEQLLRFRHNSDGSSYPTSYGDQDFGRMKTQREFIKETAKQLLQFKNIFKLGNLMDIAFDGIKFKTRKLDENGNQVYDENNKEVWVDVDLNKMKDYIPYAVEFNTEDLKSDMLPGKSELVNGVWIYSADKVETKKVVKELFFNEENNEEENETLITEKSLKIEILDGVDNMDILGEVKKKLENKGYKVVKAGQTTQTSKTIIVNRTNQTATEENSLKEVIGTGVISSSEDNSNVDFTIIIGSDYSEK